MNVGLSIWDKLTRVVMVLLLVASVFAVIQWYRPVVAENERRRQDKMRLERQIDRELEIGKKLESQLNAMKDPKTVERLAREKLSWAKPGENVILFYTPSSNGLPERSTVP